MLSRQFFRQCMSVYKASACVKLAYTTDAGEQQKMKYYNIEQNKHKLNNKRDIDNRRKLFLGVSGDTPLEVRSLYKLSPDIEHVHVHQRREGGKCAFLTFASEEKAEENFIQLRKLNMPGADLQFIGAKRYELRELTRLVLFTDERHTTKEDIQKLSGDIIHIHLRQNVIGRGIAFLDFENEELARKNLEKLLAMNLTVNHIGDRWLRPEDEHRALYIEFTETGTTNKDVKALSPDILKYQLKRHRSGMSFALLVFETEEKMEENLKAFLEQGYFADYVGSKKDSFLQANAPRTLTIMSDSTDISRDSIKKLSSDIEFLRILYKPLHTSIVFVRFPTEELAQKNLAKFLEMGLRVEPYRFMPKEDGHIGEVNQLEQLCKERKWGQPVYEMVDVSRDVVNRKTYVVKVCVGERYFMPETGRSTMGLAKNNAARLALEELQHAPDEEIDEEKNW